MMKLKEEKKLDEANTYRNILVAMNLNQHQFFCLLNISIKGISRQGKVKGVLFSFELIICPCRGEKGMRLLK